MTIKRYGIEGGTGTGGQKLPFARAVEADGWLYISGQTPMREGEVVEGGIIEQTRLAFDNCLSYARGGVQGGGCCTRHGSINRRPLLQFL